MDFNGPGDGVGIDDGIRSPWKPQALMPATCADFPRAVSYVTIAGMREAFLRRRPRSWSSLRPTTHPRPACPTTPKHDTSPIGFGHQL